MRRLIITLAAFTLAAIPVSATVIHVPGDYTTIQGGIDAAVDGDTVLVADGTYTGDGNRDMDFGGKAIVVKSENGPEFTIIDCEGANYDEHRGFKFQSGETTESILEGFTIQNGWALWDGPNGDRRGGAIYCTGSSPTVSNCLLSSNYAGNHAGAVYCEDNSSPIFVGCIFSENSSNAGAFYGISSSPSFSNCLFVENEVNTIVLGDASAVFENCTFENSDFTALRVMGYNHAISLSNCIFQDNPRGAIHLSGSSLTATDCVFIDNSRAIHAESGALHLTGCDFVRNSHDSYGGAIYSRLADLYISGCVFINNSADHGGAISCRSEVGGFIVNSTFYGNSAELGAALSSNGTDIAIINSIIAFSPQGEAIHGGAPTLSCSDIYGNAGGDWVGYIAPQYGQNGNFSEDPLFCDTSYNVLTLTSNSPCAPDNNSCGVLIGAYGVSCSGMYNFSLITPPTDSLYLYTPDEFMWHSTTDVDSGFAASYRFYIDDDPQFGSPDSSDVLSDTTYSLPDTLSRSVLYYWRVLAFNDFAIPRFSAETWNLYIDGYPGLPEIIAPSDGAVADSTTYFAWLITTDPDSFDAVTYSIQIDDDPQFNSPEIDQSGLGSGLLLDDAYAIRLGDLMGFDNLVQGTTYYWRVRSDDLYGLSSDWTDGTNYFFFLVRTGVNGDQDRLPDRFFISQNYPNPFNARTTIEYGLPEAARVTVEVYNLLGRKVETLVNQHQQAGYHQITWDASEVSSGVYFYKIQAREFIEIRKMLLLK